MSNEDYTVKKIELNSAGIIALLQSQPVMDMLEKTANEKIGTVDSTFVGFDRCHVVCIEDGGAT